MSGETQILREYLVALGFKVDENEGRKFDDRLLRLDKRGDHLGRTLVGVAAAAVALTTVFARSMEKMFYSARYADTTVEKLQGIEYAGRQIGLAGGEASGAVKGMAAAIRANPGLIGFLEKMGVPVKGRTMDQVMLDFVKATKSMPPYVAQQYASLFGIGPETLYNLQQGADKLEEFMKQRKQMADELGVNADEAARVAVEYSQMWRDLTENAGLFGQAILIEVMPQVKQLMSMTKDLMKDWVHIVQEIGKGGSEDFWKRIREGVTGVAEGGGVKLTEEQKRRIGAPLVDLPGPDRYEQDTGHERRWKRLLKRFAPGMFGRQVGKDRDAVEAATGAGDVSPGGKDYPNVDTVPPQLIPENDAGDTSPGGQDFPNVDSIPDRKLVKPQEDEGAGDTSPGGKDYGSVDAIPDDTARKISRRAYLARLEARYRLPRGLLDRTWNQESARGVKMRSPKGAQGHFGFMPKTAQEYGLKDPDNFEESANAAARKWKDLLERYDGNTRLAAAAYNWGDGNLARFGLGNAPVETQKYMDAVAGKDVNVQQNTEVHVHGVSDPTRAGDIVVRRQREANADLVRNLGPKIK